MSFRAAADDDDAIIDAPTSRTSLSSLETIFEISISFFSKQTT
jgi:hypothetical protein